MTREQVNELHDAFEFERPPAEEDMVSCDRPTPSAIIGRIRERQFTSPMSIAQRSARQREVAIGNTFTLWGVKLSPGDSLDDAQRAQLDMIARNPVTDVAIVKVVRAILDCAPEPAPSILEPIEFTPDIPPELADEMTVRAREALIATGQFVGMEEQVRLGFMDNLSGVQSAIAVLRDMGVPVSDIRRRVPVQHTTILQPLPQLPSRWERLASWAERMQHRWVKLFTRYEAQKARNTELREKIAATIRHYEDRLEVANQQLREVQDEQQLREEQLREVQDELRKTKIELGDLRIREKKASYEKSLKSLDKIVPPKGGSGARPPAPGPSKGETSLAAFLNQASPQERDAMLELAKHALATRRVDPHTGEIVVSMKVGRFKVPGPVRPTPPGSRFSKY